MAEFRVIDADSHVEEPEEAWGYLDPKYEARRPFPITGENRPFMHNMNSFWYIDGSVYPKVAGQGVTIYATPVTMARAKLKPFSLDSQTLLEPGGAPQRYGRWRRGRAGHLPDDFSRTAFRGPAVRGCPNEELQ